MSRCLRLLAVCLFFGTMFPCAPVFGYGIASDINYSTSSGVLSGYSQTWKDPWDYDIEQYCFEWGYDDYYGWYCSWGEVYQYNVYVWAGLYTPSSILDSAAAVLAWHNALASYATYPSEEGVWTGVGDHYRYTLYYQYYCEPPYLGGACYPIFWYDYYSYLGTTLDQTEVCIPEKATIIAEYQQYQSPPVFTLVPACADFTQTRRSLYFSFAEFNTGDHAWALLRDPLIAAAGSGHGLDLFRESFGGPRIINSAYRNPARNFDPTVGGAVGSRHMSGDAADVRNQSCPSSQNCPSPTPWVEWDQMVLAGVLAYADFIEPASGPCDVHCVHVDWRDVPGDYQ